MTRCFGPRERARKMAGRVRPLVLVAEESDQGLRLDRFIRKRSRVLSRIRARDLLEAGAVFLNGRRVKIASRPLRLGDRVEVFPPPPPMSSGPPAGMKPYRVVYEDGAVIVVDKASGVLVQPTPQGDRGTLLALVRRHLRAKQSGKRQPYLGLIHRIDRETSGLLLFSLRGAANRVLAEQFRTHSIRRRYLALVWGNVTEESGTIRQRLLRPSPHRRRTTVRGGERGKTAVTHYRLRERFGAATLLEVTLETGRTHQIRVHLTEQGYPVVGDKVYGRGPRPPEHPVLGSFPRQALHAAQLGFTHPFSGAWLEFESPLPPDFANLLEALRRRATR